MKESILKRRLFIIRTNRMDGRVYELGVNRVRATVHNGYLGDYYLTQLDRQIGRRLNLDVRMRVGDIASLDVIVHEYFLRKGKRTRSKTRKGALYLGNPMRSRGIEIGVTPSRFRALGFSSNQGYLQGLCLSQAEKFLKLELLSLGCLRRMTVELNRIKNICP